MVHFQPISDGNDFNQPEGKPSTPLHWQFLSEGSPGNSLLCVILSFPVGRRGLEGAAPAVLKPANILRNTIDLILCKLFDSVHGWSILKCKVLVKRKSLQVGSQQ